nr:hypothetical protein JVH1_4755 [Rhodococcus sp. JVH1]
MNCAVRELRRQGDVADVSVEAVGMEAHAPGHGDLYNRVGSSCGGTASDRRRGGAG